MAAPVSTYLYRNQKEGAIVRKMLPSLHLTFDPKLLVGLQLSTRKTEKYSTLEIEQGFCAREGRMNTESKQQPGHSTGLMSAHVFVSTEPVPEADCKEKIYQNLTKT